jgi:uncharacterized protein (TIGR02996 family)
MSDPEPLLAAYRERPDDAALRLVLADRLEELGDPRAAWLRDAALAPWLGPDLTDPLPRLLDAFREGKDASARRALTRLGPIALPGLLRLMLGMSIAAWERSLPVVRAMGEASPALAPHLAALRSDDPREQRAALGAIGDLGEAGAPALAHLLELLREDRESVRQAAIKALGRFGTLAAVALQAAWRDLEHDDRAGAGALFDEVERLGPASEALPVLIAGLGAGGNIAEYAFNRLSRMGPAVAGAVIDELGCFDSDRRGYATSLLCSFGADVLPLLLRVSADAGREPDVCAGAIEALGELGERGEMPDEAPEIVRRLLGLADDPQWEVRTTALDALARFGAAAAPAVPDLIRLLQTADDDTRAAALRVLLAVGPAAAPALPAVRALAARPQYHVRTAAAELLKNLGDLGPADDVRAGLRHRSAAERERALQRLADLAGQMPDAPDLLRQALEDRRVNVRRAGAGALSAFRFPEGNDATELFRVALRDTDAQVRSTALHALENRPVRLEAIQQELLGLCRKGRADDRRAALAALVRSSARSPEALAAFRAGARDPDEYVRRAALAGLGKSAAQSPGAVADLFALLHSEDMRTAHEALEELDRLPEPPPGLVPTLAVILRAPTVRHLDEAAAQTLARLGYQPTDADLPALLRVIEAQNTAMAFGAATLLARLGAAAVPGLTARLGAEPRQVRSCAARALADIGPPAAVALPALAALLTDPDEWVRQAAIAAVGKVGAPAEAARVLRPCFRDRQGGVRAAAVRLCRELGPASLPLLPEMLDLLATEEEYSISTELHRALGGLAAAAPEAVAALRELLRAPGPMRLQACFALAQSGPGAAAAVPELLALLDSDEEMARRAAAEALGRMGPAAAVAVPRLLRWVEAKRAAALRQTALQTLGRLGPVAADSVPALTKCLRSSDRWSRLYAAQALGRMGAAAAPAVPLLEALAKRTDQQVRAAAEEALASVRQAAGLTTPAPSSAPAPAG